MFYKSKVLIATFFILFLFETQAQEVSNVQVKFSGGKAMITYNLDNGVPAYFVELLYSSDGGMTFSDPLKRISGDAGNVNSGAGKKIIWNAEEEIGYFSGEMIFRVVANVRTARMPEVIEVNAFSVEVKSCYVKYGKLYLNLIYTPKADLDINLKERNTYLVNSQGGTHALSSIKFIVNNDHLNKCIAGIPYDVQCVFDNYSSEHTLIPKVFINQYYSWSEKDYEIENIPVAINF